MVLPHPPPSPEPHPFRPGRILPWPVDLLGRKGPDPGPPLSLALPGRGRPFGNRGTGGGPPRRVPLPLQAFLAGALLVLILHWVSPAAQGSGSLPQGIPAPAIAQQGPASLDPPGLEKLAGRLWEARAWPSLWKKGPLLGRAREALDKARALEMESLAARMEMLLEIYGPARR